jgi:hypothetical protein
MAVQFISEQTLKQLSVIQENVDMKLITPAIYEVQNFYLLPILGTSLYNELITQIQDNTLTDANRQLIDIYITPVLVWYVRLELPMHLNFKYFNKAVGSQNADNMSPITDAELSTLMNFTKNKAEWHSERLTKFLLSNPTVYPLFLNQPNANIDTIFAKMSNYTSGMVLGDDGCCQGKYNFKGIPIQPPEIRVECCL